jgi:hypothetical protein
MLGHLLTAFALVLVDGFFVAGESAFPMRSIHSREEPRGLVP